MTGATHMIMSAAIYSLGIFDKPFIPAVTFGSHFLLDAAPHYGMRRDWNYLLSAATGTFLIFKGLKQKDCFLLPAVFFGILPDVIDKLGLSMTFSKIHDSHYFKGQAPNYFLVIELLAAALLLVHIIA
jgi:hypothetical protein